MSDPSASAFVPSEFEIPSPPDHIHFRFEPLGAQHNERDYEAWMGSIDHIKATPGFIGRDWPEPMTLEANLSDLVKHADDFAAHTGFTWSVLSPVGDDVIGCLYIYPSRSAEFDADVRSWVTAEHAALDRVVWQVVTNWLNDDWPFAAPEYAARR